MLKKVNLVHIECCYYFSTTILFLVKEGHWNKLVNAQWYMLISFARKGCIVSSSSRLRKWPFLSFSRATSAPFVSRNILYMLTTAATCWQEPPTTITTSRYYQRISTDYSIGNELCANISEWCHDLIDWLIDWFLSKRLSWTTFIHPRKPETVKRKYCIGNPPS